MSVIYGILAVLYILGCIGINTMILMQKKRSAGMGSIAGMGQSQTYWDKNKGRSFEGALEKYTKIGACVIGALTVVMCIIS